MFNFNPLEILDEVLGEMELCDEKRFLRHKEPDKQIVDGVHAVKMPKRLRALQVMAASLEEDCKRFKLGDEDSEVRKEEFLRKLHRAAVIEKIFNSCLYKYYGFWGRGEVIFVSGGRVYWNSRFRPLKTEQEVVETRHLWIDEIRYQLANMKDGEINDPFGESPENYKVIGTLGEEDSCAKKLITIVRDATGDALVAESQCYKARNRDDFYSAGCLLDIRKTFLAALLAIHKYYIAMRFNHWRLTAEYKVCEGWQVIIEQEPEEDEDRAADDE